MRSVVAAVIVGSATGIEHCGPPPSAPFPAVEDLKPCASLPDPWLRADGTRVGDMTEWSEHRLDMIAMLEHYMYGQSPPADAAVVFGDCGQSYDNGFAIQQNCSVSVGPDRNQVVTTEVFIYKPKEGTGPFPTFVVNDGTFGCGDNPDGHAGGSANNDQHTISPTQKEMLVQRGNMIVLYDRDIFRIDCMRFPYPEYGCFPVKCFGHEGPGTKAGLQTLYPEYDWGSIAVWAWGGSRIIDWILSDDALSPLVDSQKLMSLGHSRGGKTALWQAVKDERISISFPMMSGEGGCGSLRFHHEDITHESVFDLTGLFPTWFAPQFAELGSPKPWGHPAEESAPWDQHLQRALIAPRAALDFNGKTNYHENPEGSQSTFEAARKVYEWMGVPERQGIHYHESAHPSVDADFVAVGDFAEWVFFGVQSGNMTEFSMKPYDLPQRWDWEAPTSQVRVMI